MNHPDAKVQQSSIPDLESLDAAWDGDSDEALDHSDTGLLDDVDEGWETVPDPAGGPPIRRRRSPKERARARREKQRAKADVAAKKQKGKQAKRRDADGRTVPPSDAPEPVRTSKRDAAPRESPSVARARKKGLDARTVAMIAAALAVAAAALYFMMSSRP